ncbi:MAG: metal-sensitive transcriptional regulator [Acidimicrobiia bacterium]|jgi:DNA-binding FrmR family transcriptional regulator
MTDQSPERSGTGASESATSAGPRHLLECRVRRIEGQVRGVLHMLEEGRRTEEVLVQLASIRGAVHGLEQQLVGLELERFVEDVLRDGRPAADAALRDLSAAIGHVRTS